jgi:hypothetical protein
MSSSSHNASVTVTVNGQQAAQQFGYIQTAANSFASAVTGKLAGMFSAVAIGAGAFSKLQHAMKENIATAKQVNQMSIKFGVDPTEVHSMKLAADDAGVSIRALMMGFKTFGATAMKGIASRDIRKDFEQLGFSAEQLRNMATKPAKGFAELSVALMKIGDETERQQAGQMALGRAYEQLKPLIQEIGTSEEKRNEFLKNENAMTNEQIASHRKIGILMSGLNDQWNRMVAEAAPIIEIVVDFIQYLMQGMRILAQMVQYWKILNSRGQTATLTAVEEYALNKEQLAAKAKYKREQGQEATITEAERKAESELMYSDFSGLQHAARQFERVSVDDRIRAIKEQEAAITRANPTRTDKLTDEQIAEKARKENEAQEAGKNLDFDLAKRILLNSPDFAAFTGETDPEKIAEMRRKFEAATDFSDPMNPLGHGLTRERAMGWLRKDVGANLTSTLRGATGASQRFNATTGQFVDTDPLKALKDKTLVAMRETAALEKEHSDSMAKIRKDVNKSRARLFKVIYDPKIGAERPMTQDEIKRMEKDGVGVLFGEKPVGRPEAPTEEEGTFKSTKATRQEKLAKTKHERALAAAKRKLEAASLGTPLAEKIEDLRAIEDQMAEVSDDKTDKEPELVDAQKAYDAAVAVMNNITKNPTNKQYTEGEVSKAKKAVEDTERTLAAIKTDMEKFDIKMLGLDANRVKALEAVEREKMALAERTATNIDRWDEMGHKKKIRMMQLEGKTAREITDEKFKYESNKLQEMEKDYRAYYEAAYADGQISGDEYKKLQEMYGELRKQYSDTDDAAFATITQGGGGVVSQLGRVGGGMALGGEANMGKAQYDELRKANGYLNRIEAALAGGVRDSSGIYVPGAYPSDAKPK